MNLHDYLARSAGRAGEAIAVEELSGAAITYRGLATLAESLRRYLIGLGVQPGDRVGIYLHKSIDAVAAIFGVLEAGAAYVPLDPAAPVRRNAFILQDCAVRVLIVERSLMDLLVVESSQPPAPDVLVVDGVGGGRRLAAALHAPGRVLAERQPPRRLPSSSLAYVLYTSGSTGNPKGVMLSHGNGVSFVEWCLRTFGARSSDRISSHAAFNFDLSIHDIFVSMASGAALVLFPESVTREARLLAQAIADKRISIWYSVPYILGLMAQFGQLDAHEHASLRAVLFAGEVFPIAQLRALCEKWPAAKYYNLYGPTETNVCAHYEVPTPIPRDRTDPVPLGSPCDQLEARVIDADENECAPGAEGELCIAGPNVLLGYWNLPEQTERAFLPGDRRFYRTGDVVVKGSDGVLRFVGRRDRMVKKRGYRVELGEIETCLYAHPRVKEVAVVASQDEATGVVITANLGLMDAGRLSIIALREYCSARLPAYMVPDRFNFLPELPRTRTDKIDYQRLGAAHRGR